MSKFERKSKPSPNQSNRPVLHAIEAVDASKEAVDTSGDFANDDHPEVVELEPVADVGEEPTSSSNKEEVNVIQEALELLRKHKNDISFEDIEEAEIILRGFKERPLNDAIDSLETALNRFQKLLGEKTKFNEEQQERYDGIIDELVKFCTPDEQPVGRWTQSPAKAQKERKARGPNKSIKELPPIVLSTTEKNIAELVKEDLKIHRDTKVASYEVADRLKEDKGTVLKVLKYLVQNNFAEDHGAGPSLAFSWLGEG